MLASPESLRQENDGGEGEEEEEEEEEEHPRAGGGNPAKSGQKKTDGTQPWLGCLTDVNCSTPL